MLAVTGWGEMGRWKRSRWPGACVNGQRGWGLDGAGRVWMEGGGHGFDEVSGQMGGELLFLGLSILGHSTSPELRITGAAGGQLLGLGLDCGST